MRVRNRKKLALFFCISLFLLTCASPTKAVGLEFNRIDLDFGISIEIPRDWIILSEERVHAFELLLEDIYGNLSEGEKDLLLLAAVEPTEAYKASVIVLVSPKTSKSHFTQTNLQHATQNATHDELQKASGFFLDAIMSEEFKEMGFEIYGADPLRLENINGLYSIVQEYTRTEKGGYSPWRVMQCLMPTSTKIVQLVLQYKASSESEFRPILIRVKESLRLQEDTSDWPSLNIKNLGSINYPPTMELQSADYRKRLGMPKRTNNYTFQQKGLNEGLQTSFRHYVRLIVDVIEGSPGDFLRISDSQAIVRTSEEELKTFQSIILENERNQGIEIIDTYEPKIVFLNSKYPAILIAYKRKSTVPSSDQGPVMVRRYLIQNWKYCYSIVASYRVIEEDLWKDDLLKSVNSLLLEKEY